MLGNMGNIESNGHKKAPMYGAFLIVFLVIYLISLATPAGSAG